MKKILLLLLSALLTLTVFAQEEGAAEKNAGNAAWKAKNYAEAFKNFEAYLKIVKFENSAYVYNTAVAATKAKMYPAAEKYFDMAIQKKYKAAASYLGKAKAQKAQKKEAEMLATLEAGIKAVTGNTMKLETMYATHFLKAGQKFQKSGNEAKAVESYKKITTLPNKNFKVQGFASLGGLYFNKGAKILQAATAAGNNKAKYDAEKVKAVAAFKQAKTYLVQGQGLDATNEDIKGLLKQVADAMK